MHSIKQSKHIYSSIKKNKRILFFKYLNKINTIDLEMAGWKALFLVKMMTLYNYLCNTFSTIRVKTTNFYYYIKDYFYGHHDTWLFIPGHTFPVALTNISNVVQINWMYDNSDSSLIFVTDGDVEKNCYKFSWLSAKIRVITADDKDHAIEYEIDDFIERFSLYTFDRALPTLYMIFLCWCAYTKHWFSHSDTIEFHIINDMGEDIVIDIKKDIYSIYIQHNKLHISTDDNEITHEDVAEPETTEETPLMQEEKKKDD